jgi:hypothetical protein
MRVRQGMPVHTRHTLWLRHCPKHAAAAATLLIVRPHALSVRSRPLLAVVTVRQLILHLLSRCYGRLPSRTLRRIGPIAKPCATPRLRTTAPTRARNLRPYARSTAPAACMPSVRPLQSAKAPPGGAARGRGQGPVT